MPVSKTFKGHCKELHNKKTLSPAPICSVKNIRISEIRLLYRLSLCRNIAKKIVGCNNSDHMALAINDRQATNPMIQHDLGHFRK
jgi:hypothetical protein